MPSQGGGQRGIRTMSNRWTRVLGAVAVLSMAACGGDAGDQAEAPADTQAAEPAAQPDASLGFGANVAYPEGVTAEMAAAGQTLFNQTVCFTCHGQNGTGTPLAPPLNDNTWINIADGSYEQIVEVIRTGVPQPKQFTNAGAMPPMGGAQLTDEQVSQLAAYVFALSHGG